MLPREISKFSRHFEESDIKHPLHRRAFQIPQDLVTNYAVRCLDTYHRVVLGYHTSSSFPHAKVRGSTYLLHCRESITLVVGQVYISG